MSTQMDSAQYAREFGGGGEDILYLDRATRLALRKYKEMRDDPNAAFDPLHWEHARSYAVEAATGILNANPALTLEEDE